MTDSASGGKQLRWEGMSFLTSTNQSDTRDTANKVKLTADDDGVRYRAEGFDNGKVAEVETQSSHVRAYLNRIDEANRAATAIIPFTKEMQVGKSKSKERRDLNEQVNCPVCKGDQRFSDCPLCGDRRAVTLREARQFLDLM